jgi:ubiquinone biosynthesis protein
MALKSPITSIPQIYRNIRRTTEIATILSKYGLNEVIRLTGLDTLIPGWRRGPADEALERERFEVRIRRALVDLGPTFIKLGQFLSTRPDVVGVELASELQALQSQVDANSFSVVKEIVERELGRPLEDLFLSFEPVAIAAGSIGQAHLARLHSGQEVVVKIQHPNIETQIKTDMEILTAIAQLAEQFEELKHYQPTMLISQWQRVITAELNFRREQQRLEQFGTLMAKEKGLKIPVPYPSHSSHRVLTMERIVGRSVHSLNREIPAGMDLSQIARNGAEIYLKMIFRHGVYHADPHGGNIIIMEDGRIALIDFGMVGRISPNLRESIEEILLAVINQDVGMLELLIRHVGLVPNRINLSDLDSDLADFVSQYTTQTLDNFDVSGALNDIVTLVRRHHITLPAEMALLIKTLVSLEGTGRLLNPHFNLMEILAPLRRSMILDRWSPKRTVRRLRRLMFEVEHLVDRLPERIGSILKMVQEGEINVQINHHRLGPNVNRLVMGMMTSAMFLGSSVLLSMKVPPVLFREEGPWGMRDISVAGALGLLLSLALGLRVLWSIRKSGHLDSEDG